MSTDVLINLLQIILLTVATVVVMLVAAFRRDHGLVSGLTQFGLFAALTVFVFIKPVLPMDATPLLRIDEFSLFFSTLVIIGGMVVTALAYPYFAKVKDQNEEFYLLLLMATIGGVVLSSSQHFVSFLLGMETLSISLYAMIAYPLHSNKSVLPLEASVKYLILSASASAIMLFGIALIYAQTGSLGFDGLAGGLSRAAGDPYLMGGLLMLVAGIAFKLSLVPFHMWTPDVYEGAPVPVTAYIATVSKAAMVAVVLRAFIVADVWSVPAVTTVLAVMAGISMVVGNLLALLQQNVKRLLAYSSIAHLGYVLVVLVAGAEIVNGLTLESVGFYMAAYVLTSLAGFAVVSALSSSGAEMEAVASYRGLFWRNPWLAAVMTTVLLSLAGIPLTMGFIGKFYIVTAGVEAQTWGLLALLVIGSGIGLYYYLRLIYLMLQDAEQNRGSDPAAAPIPVGIHVALAVTAAAIVYYGVFPNSIIEHLQVMTASL